ncbi:MAG TPA: energy transducer TonB [Acidobacteriaceae bacterium]|nr:energy transducer TonB [Acidobacteriaceae bacterium]
MIRFLLLFLFLPTFLYSQVSPASTVQPPSETAKPTPTNPKTPKEFFARARQFSDLEAAGIPFHLKATYVATGDTEFTGDGTIEEWWQSKDVWRKEVTFGEYRSVLIKNGQPPEFYGTSDSVPMRLIQANAAILIHIASGDESSRRWKMANKNISGVDLDVLSKNQSAFLSNKISEEVQYYFTPEGILRVQRNGDLITYYNNFQAFKNLLTPRTIEFTARGKRLLTISIETLDPLTQSKEAILGLTSAPKNLPLIGSALHTTSPDGQLQVISMVYPVYPSNAKAEKIQGSVGIRVTIDGKGKVRDPHVLSSTAKSLNEAALDAVRQRRYQPTVLDGIPVNVVTIIFTVFSLDS